VSDVVRAHLRATGAGPSWRTLTASRPSTRVPTGPRRGRSKSTPVRTVWNGCLAERPGNVVVLSATTGARWTVFWPACARACTVLADKPWIIEGGGVAQLEAALTRGTQDVVAFDAMTQRHEITSCMQRSW